MIQIVGAETIQKISFFDKQCLSTNHSESRRNSKFLFCLYKRLFHLHHLNAQTTDYSTLQCLNNAVSEIVVTEFRICLQNSISVTIKIKL